MNIEGDIVKRTCKGCKALTEVGVIAYNCEFGYKTDGFAKPLEDCPKPRTYEEYIKLLESRKVF